MTDTRTRPLIDQVAQRAAAEGLLDVGYAWTDSPLGRLLVAATPQGVVRLAFEGEDEDAVLASLASQVSPRVLHAPVAVQEAHRQLDDYFAGRRTAFELPLDRRLMRGFRRRVLDVTAAIPYAATATYRAVATRAGNAAAVRAAGSALATNPIPVIVPCHRVLRTDGALGGYRGGLDAKRILLEHERAHAGA